MILTTSVSIHLLSQGPWPLEIYKGIRLHFRKHKKIKIYGILENIGRGVSNLHSSCQLFQYMMMLAWSRMMVLFLLWLKKLDLAIAKLTQDESQEELEN